MRVGTSIKITLSCLLLALCVTSPVIAETDNHATEISSAAADSTGSNDTLRAYLQLQEQLHATQLAIERTRHDAEEANAKSAEALTAQLRLVEQKLSVQRVGETKFIVYILSAFAALSFLAVVITAYFQWRTVSRLADFTATLPLGRTSPPVTAGALAMGDTSNANAVEQSSSRLLGAVERLEKRILELEHAALPALKNGAGRESKGNGSHSPDHAMEASTLIETFALTTNPDQPERIKLLLEQGQTFLNEDRAEAAVEAFDQALALDSENTEAMVKKGAALEKLRKFQEALDCYDQAIATDSSMTIAYLYKGGLYNRLERFSEAVECYEKALRTQEKSAA